MKLKHAMTLSLALVLSLQLRASDLPAPMPEFMDQQQLAKWNADMTAKANTPTATGTSTQFYTGKPYVADAGGYIFKYRTYNPEMCRWTSADPSGFPDGANNEKYSPVPTGELDSNGLITITGLTAPNLSTLPVSYNGANYTVQSITDTITSIPASSFNSSFPGYTFTTGSSSAIINVNSSSVYNQGDGSGGETLSLSVTNEYDNLPPSWQIDNTYDWVQVITTTYPANGHIGPTYIDGRAGQSDPFYGTYGTADASYFYDEPRRPYLHATPGNPITWSASLYYVSVNLSDEVTVYGGVQWNWEITAE